MKSSRKFIYMYISLLVSDMLDVQMYCVCILLLFQDTKLYFKVHLRKRLRWKELNPLYNKWFILMLFANALIVIASMMKIFIGYRVCIV